MLISSSDEYTDMPAAKAEALHLALDKQVSNLLNRLPMATDDYAMYAAVSNLATLHEEMAVVFHAAMTVWPDSHEQRRPEVIADGLVDINDRVRVLRLLETLFAARCTGDPCPGVDLSHWPELAAIGTHTCYRVTEVTSRQELAFCLGILQTMLDGDGKRHRGILLWPSADAVMQPIIAALRD